MDILNNNKNKGNSKFNILSLSDMKSDKKELTYGTSYGSFSNKPKMNIVGISKPSTNMTYGISKPNLNFGNSKSDSKDITWTYLIKQNFDLAKDEFIELSTLSFNSNSITFNDSEKATVNSILKKFKINVDEKIKK